MGGLFRARINTNIKKMRESSKLKHARRLRRDMTMAERKVWAIVRGRQIGGCYFRRQAPIGPFVADFVCVDRKLVIEIDGGQHYRPDQLSNDERRTRYLRDKGYRVLRFSNKDVFENLEGVHHCILRALDENLT